MTLSGPQFENSLVVKARAFAVEAHAGQPYGENGMFPMIDHLDGTAAIAAAMGFKTPELLATCYLHDTVEDAGVTYKDLVDEGFPLVTVQGVWGVTSLKPTPKVIKILRAMSNPVSHVNKTADSNYNLAANLRPEPQMAESDTVRRIGKYSFYICMLAPSLPTTEELDLYVSTFEPQAAFMADMAELG